VICSWRSRSFAKARSSRSFSSHAAASTRPVRSCDGGLRQRLSTRSVDDLVAAMGVDTGISKSEVSRIYERLDERVAAFRGRTVGHIAFPYV